MRGLILGKGSTLGGYVCKKKKTKKRCSDRGQIQRAIQGKRMWIVCEYDELEKSRVLQQIQNPPKLKRGRNKCRTKEHTNLGFRCGNING